MTKNIVQPTNLAGTGFNRDLNEFRRMSSKSVPFLGILLVAFQATQSSPTNLVNRTNGVVFEFNTTIQINRTDFTELNCIARNSMEAFACSNISQISCLAGDFGEVRSCSVSNEDSLFFGTSVVNEISVCNDNAQIKGNCHLIFSPELSNSKSVGQTISQILSFV